eukprot:m.159804 g.159804  ORF g.159804 m.159804 type:complete len:530 (+) comp23758_c0_seq1:107-1696(+)
MITLWMLMSTVAVAVVSAGTVHPIDQTTSVGTAHTMHISGAVSAMTVDENATCAQCIRVLDVVQDCCENATSAARTIAALGKKCDSLFPKSPSSVALCDRLSNASVNLLKFLEKEADSLAWSSDALCAALGECTVGCCGDTVLPEQVHLSLTGTPSTMAVMWTTASAVPGVVTWGLAGSTLSSHAASTTDTYTDFGWRGYLHTATMINLTLGVAYEYKVGDGALAESAVFHFRTMAANVGTVDTPLRVASIADMGWGPASDDTIAQLTHLAVNGEIDLIIHNGDISYADGNMAGWDKFLRKIEAYATVVPVLVTPGNHEFWFNFTAYKKRFAMPSRDATQNMYYSLDVGTVRLVAMNTESELDIAAMSDWQVEFLKSVLAPPSTWTVAYGHRPFYCTNKGPGNVPKGEALLRKKAEAVLNDGGVQVVLSGHVHDYERSLPVRDGLPTAQDYLNISAPFYVVNGAAGNRESNDHPPGGASWSPPVDPTGATTSLSHAVSYGILTFAGPTLRYEQRFSTNGSVFDSFVVTC